MIAAAFLCTSAYAEVSITTGAGYMPMSKRTCKGLPTGNWSESCRKLRRQHWSDKMLAQVAAGNGVNIVISDLGTLKTH